MLSMTIFWLGLITLSAIICFHLYKSMPKVTGALYKHFTNPHYSRKDKTQAICAVIAVFGGLFLFLNVESQTKNIYLSFGSMFLLCIACYVVGASHDLVGRAWKRKREKKESRQLELPIAKAIK